MSHRTICIYEYTSTRTTHDVRVIFLSGDQLAHDVHHCHSGNRPDDSHLTPDVSYILVHTYVAGYGSWFLTISDLYTKHVSGVGDFESCVMHAIYGDLYYVSRGLAFLVACWRSKFGLFVDFVLMSSQRTDVEKGRAGTYVVL